MRRLLTLAISLLLFCAAPSVEAAYFENIPRSLLQPNGDTLHCFATGDEFYHFLHDADGYTIVQRSDGYFVYAAQENGHIVPTEFIAGKVSPRAVGLQPHLTISKEDYLARRAKMQAPASLRPAKSREATTNRGEINNLVVFINFYGEYDFEQSGSEVNAMFNDSSATDANSMYNYFKQASYNQLFIKSHLVPNPVNDNIIAYNDPHPRLYYEPLTDANPIGYPDSNDEVRTEREMTLLTNAIHFVESQIPSGIDFDYNDDGLIDNVCFVVKGNVGDWSDLLWPHRWVLYTDTVLLNGLRVFDFNFQLSDNAWYFSNSTLCHEMFHTLGAPDLYHYSDEHNFTPVGTWDLMAQNANPPQHSGAYMKFYYGNWIDSIPTINESGRYTVKAISGNDKERLAFRIPSEIESEYFVVECRKKTGAFESGIPNSGLLIYRINSDFEGMGNADYDGEDILDEIYVYRPGGTLSEDGILGDATFRQGAGRTSFDYSTDPKPFLSNGYISAIRIYDIHSYLDSVSFSYLKPGDTISVKETQLVDLQVFPNPSQDKVNIVSDKKISEAILYDFSGKELRVFNLQNASTISIRDFQDGSYFLKIIFEDGKTGVQKLIKRG